MSRMIRKQVYITPEQEALLKRRAKALGVSEAELVRRGVELAGRSRAALAPDDAAWEAELRFIKERARIQALGRERGWTRDELYDERLERFSR